MAVSVIVSASAFVSMSRTLFLSLLLSSYFSTCLYNYLRLLIGMCMCMFMCVYVYVYVCVYVCMCGQLKRLIDCGDLKTKARVSSIFLPTLGDQKLNN